MSFLVFFAVPQGTPVAVRKQAAVYLLTGLGLLLAVATWAVLYLALLISQHSFWFTFLAGALASLASLALLVVGWGTMHGATWSVWFLPAHVRAQEEVQAFRGQDEACAGCGETLRADTRFCVTCGRARDAQPAPLKKQLALVLRRLVEPQHVEPPRTQAYTKREPHATTDRLFFAAIGLVVVGWLLAQATSAGSIGGFSAFAQVPVVLAVLVPPLVLLLWIRRQDRYEPEPLGLVLLAFAWGALTHVWVHHLELFFSWPVLAGLTREIPKALIVLFIATHRSFRREFNGPVDGLVYGAASGLGFEAVANFQLMLQGGSITTFLLSGAVPFTNMAWTGITGSWLGLMMLRRGKVTPLDLVVGAVPAAMLHGLHNMFLFLPLPTLVWTILFVGVVLASAYFFFKLLAEGLRDEAAWGYTAGKAPVEEFT